jgi:hypothetical protein
MKEAREKIISDFAQNYPEFRVSDVFLPENEFIIPVGNSGIVGDVAFYYGSDLFKSMSRIDIAKYKMQTEKDIYSANIKSIKKRYGL